MTKFRYAGARDHVTRAILAALAENGPMTRGEICLVIGRDRTECAAVVSRLNKRQKTLPKRIYIFDYVYEDELNGRRFPRARYALGDKQNARRPKPDPRGNVRRWRESQKRKVASVFDLGLTRREREARNRAVRTGCTDRRGPLQEAQNPTDGIQHGEQSGCLSTHSD